MWLFVEQRFGSVNRRSRKTRGKLPDRMARARSSTPRRVVGRARRVASRREHPRVTGSSRPALAPRARSWPVADPFDEDADIRSHLAAQGPAALAELSGILEAPSPDRTEILRALTARPTSADLATLIAMADTDEVVRLRLLRAIRNLGHSMNG